MHNGDGSEQLDRTVRLRRADVSWQRVEDQVIVLDLTRGRYLELNRTGSMLFMLLEQGASVPALVEALVENYAVEGQRAQADVGAFLASLAAQDLLER